jgi:hypothetical protein
MLKAFRVLSLTSVLLTVFQLSGYTQNPIDYFPSVSESKAYKQYRMRPDSDFSKLLFLIDRFENSGIEVVYDGHYYKAAFAAKIARWFMARNYRKETIQEWVMRWCNTSMSGKLIYVKFPNGKFRLSREVLLDEAKALEEAVKQEEAALRQEKKQSATELSIVPVASMVIKTDSGPTPPTPNPKIEAPQP